MSCGVNPSRLMTKVIKDRNAPDFGALHLSYHLITRNHVPVVGANAELAPSSSTDNGGRAVQRGCGVKARCVLCLALEKRIGEATYTDEPILLGGGRKKGGRREEEGRKKGGGQVK